MASNAIPTPGMMFASLSKFVTINAIMPPIKKMGFVNNAFPRFKTDFVKAPEPSVAPEKLSPLMFFARPLMLSEAPSKSSDPSRLCKFLRLFPALSNAGPALAPISSLKSFWASFNCSSLVFNARYSSEVLGSVVVWSSFVSSRICVLKFFAASPALLTWFPNLSMLVIAPSLSAVTVISMFEFSAIEPFKN